MHETIKRLAETLLYALNLEAEHNPAFKAQFNSGEIWHDDMTAFDFLRIGLEHVIEKGIPAKGSPLDGDDEEATDATPTA